uniref:Uncharacterized protein n=1 Tax=Caenorhabditis japonica TaxID=281687 RepID=A0A8R1IIX8_CAEJA
MYRPFVDEYEKFLQRRLEKRQKRLEEGKKKGKNGEEEEEEWPDMPPGYRILTSEEQEQKLREESMQVERTEMSQTPTATELLHDMQMAANNDFLSIFPSDPAEESIDNTTMSDNLFNVFDDRNESPLGCPIVVDTVVTDDDDSLLFAGNA